MQFMAVEVPLKKNHTYRHDLESFFYVFNLDVRTPRLWSVLNLVPTKARSSKWLTRWWRTWRPQTLTISQRSSLSASWLYHGSGSLLSLWISGLIRGISTTTRGGHAHAKQTNKQEPRKCLFLSGRSQESLEIQASLQLLTAQKIREDDARQQLASGVRRGVCCCEPVNGGLVNTERGKSEEERKSETTTKTKKLACPCSNTLNLVKFKLDRFKTAPTLTVPLALPLSTQLARKRTSTCTAQSRD